MTPFCNINKLHCKLGNQVCLHTFRNLERLITFTTRHLCLQLSWIHEFMNSWLNKVHENQVMLSWIHDLSRYMKIRWCVFVYIWMVEEFQIYFICTAEFFWEFFGNSKVFLFLTFSKSADCLHFKSQLIVYTLKFSWLFKF